jgi:hypothetical protein
MKSQTLAAIMLIVCIGALPSIVSARECSPMSLEEQIKTAHLIFFGIVESSEPTVGDSPACWQYSEENKTCGARLGKFRVAKIWKGNAIEELKVFTSDSCYCTGSAGLYNVGAKILVFATAKKVGDADYSDNGTCGGTRIVKDSELEGVVQQIVEKLAIIKVP